MPDRILGVLAVPAAVAAFLATGCGAQAPDWDILAQREIGDVCGRSFTGEEVVRLAYDGAPYAALPIPLDLPEDVLLAGVTLGGLQRRYPCAPDADSVISTLQEGGYSNLELVESREDHYLVAGDDPFDIPGTYLVLDCDFVSTLEQTVGAAYRRSGIFGEVPSYDGSELAPLQRFAEFLFETGAPAVQDVGFTPIVQPPVVALGMDDAIEDRQFCESCDPEPSLRTCATWVEPNFVGGCDRVRVGATFTVLRTQQEGEEETAPVWQTALTRDPGIELVGWCNRSQF